MDCLLDSERWTDSFADVRTRTILLTFYTTGIRLSELVGIDEDALDMENRQLKVLGKRNKQRIVQGKRLLQYKTTNLRQPRV